MEEFLNIVNKFLTEERVRTKSSCKSFLVEHKIITTNESFKAYKEYEVYIKIINQDKKPITLFHHKHTFNSSKVTPEEVYKSICNDLKLNFFRFMKTFEWDKLVNGYYEEKISNGTSN